MNNKKKLKVFEDKKVRTEWNEEEQDWYVSVVDVIGVLTDQPSQRGATLYWGKMKQRLKEEGSELLTICQQLKLAASDGKLYKTDVANTKIILRIIQSIPSPTLTSCLSKGVDQPGEFNNHFDGNSFIKHILC